MLRRRDWQHTAPQKQRPRGVARKVRTRARAARRSSHAEAAATRQRRGQRRSGAAPREHTCIESAQRRHRQASTKRASRSRAPVRDHRSVSPRSAASAREERRARQVPSTGHVVTEASWSARNGGARRRMRRVVARSRPIRGSAGRTGAEEGAMERIRPESAQSRSHRDTTTTHAASRRWTHQRRKACRST